jgi:hypothetical protein
MHLFTLKCWIVMKEHMRRQSKDTVYFLRVLAGYRMTGHNSKEIIARTVNNI